MKRTVREMVGPEARCCCNCVHYIEHYVRREGSRYVDEIDVGHCVNGRRCKSRKANDTCVYFLKRGMVNNAGTEASETQVL